MSFKLNIDNEPHQLFAPKAAEEKAKELNSDSHDDWTYEVVHCPKGTGYSYINVYDEDGNLVSKL